MRSSEFSDALSGSMSKEADSHAGSLVDPRRQTKKERSAPNATLGVQPCLPDKGAASELSQPLYRYVGGRIRATNPAVAYR